MRVLALLTDAYGSAWGIAQYNRDLLEAMASHGGVEEIVVLPRIAPSEISELPPGIVCRLEGLGSKKRYVAAALRLVRQRFDWVLCGHVNLLPVAGVVSAARRVPFSVLVYGFDAWASPGPLHSRLLRRARHIVSISEVTRDRCIRWSHVPKDVFRIVPNAVDLNRFAPQAADEELVARYGLRGRKVIMTLGRMGATERSKGFDEILEAMPRLLEMEPDLAYVAAGDGTDRPRLESKARTLGLGERVVFPGHIPEEEKARHLNLADAFVMPSHGEGFGFVFLEAMACGIPVVASRIDGGREAVRDGRLGRLVDPRDRDELEREILAALEDPKGARPDGLEYFSMERFVERCHGVVDLMLSGSPAQRQSMATSADRSPVP